MRHIILLFLGIYASLLPICGQDIAFRDTLPDFALDWQDQILQQLDIDNLSDDAYAQLLDELSELVVWSDTTASAFTLGRMRHQIVLSGNRCLNTRAGYRPAASGQSTDKTYLGGPWHQSVRYRMQAGRHWQAGFTLDRDAGEAWQHSLPWFDDWHAFIRLRDVQCAERLNIRDAVIGHYRLRMGCGLIINQGFSLGKQFMTQQLLQQRTNVITPHASLSESGYMQGVATDLRIGQHLTLLPYFSARQIDGTLNAANILTALQTDGMHRTPSEAAHRHAAWQFVSGARLGWRGEWYDVGLHGSYTQLQYDYQRSELYYNAHYFRGHQLTQFAADYHARALGFVLRGETAIDDGGALASLNTLQHALGPDGKFTLQYRYFDRHYRQLHASTVSESSGMQGEQGVLIALDAPLARHWQAQGMLDCFWFQQPQYGIRQSSSHGYEASARLTYSGSLRAGQGSLAYRFKQKGDYLRHNFDLTYTLQPLASLTLRSQLRARIYSKEYNDPTYGYAASLSAAWQCHRWDRVPFTIEGQASYFNTDNYDSRIYLTERAILYGFGLPMLYGQGLRYHVTATIAVGTHLHLDAKWAMTNYANRSSISSGLQQIAGNTQQDVWLQLRLKL